MDLKNRTQLEKQLAKELGRVNETTRKELLKLLGNPPQLENVTIETWQLIGNNYSKVLTPSLEKIFIQSVEQLTDSLGYAMDFAMVNQNAVNFASQYGFELVKGMTDTRQEHLQKAVADFYSERLDMNGLRQRIGTMYSPVRADMIAQTEVTRSASEGEKLVIEDLARNNVQMIAIFQTSNDERVCPVCSPLNGKVSSVAGANPDFNGYGLPPLHVKCRCFVNWQVYDVAEVA
jgi:SPP1 gp7 family putative phage head morphogenesis protein